MSLVYIHINKITKQKYVGITSRKAEQRWRDGLGYETQYFGKAGVEVFGWNNFTHEILIDNIDNDLAKTIEHLLIVELETTNPKYGYNTDTGKPVQVYMEEAKQYVEMIAEDYPHILRRGSGVINLNAEQVETVREAQAQTEYKVATIGPEIKLDIPVDYPVKKRKSKLLAWILCYFFGLFGGHYFYLGYKTAGFIYMFTFGLFGFGWIFDLITLPFRKIE